MRKGTLERSFWTNNIKPVLNRLKADAQRLEVATARGVPDVNACHNGNEIWIELKVASKGQIELRKEQYVWGLRRARAGGKVFVVALKHDIVQIWLYPFRVRYTNGRYCHPVTLPNWALHKDDLRSDENMLAILFRS